jgi:hypothetical protein
LAWARMWEEQLEGWVEGCRWAESGWLLARGSGWAVAVCPLALG